MFYAGGERRKKRKKIHRGKMFDYSFWKQGKNMKKKKKMHSYFPRCCIGIKG